MVRSPSVSSEDSALGSVSSVCVQRNQSSGGNNEPVTAGVVTAGRARSSARGNAQARNYCFTINKPGFTVTVPQEDGSMVVVESIDAPCFKCYQQHRGPILCPDSLYDSLLATYQSTPGAVIKFNRPEYESAEVTYLCYGLEQGSEESTFHWQGMIIFNRKKRFQGVKHYFGCNHMHIEVMKGTPLESKRYCLKDYLHKPDDNGVIDCDLCMAHDDPEDLKDGEMCPRTDPDMYGEHYVNLPHSLKENAGQKLRDQKSLAFVKAVHGGLSKYEAAFKFPSFIMKGTYERVLHAVKESREGAAKVIYIHGIPGIGKTTSVMRELKARGIKYYKKVPNQKWFDGYSCQKYCVMDEYSSDIPVTSFNAMMDPDPPALPVKGGFVPNCAETYFVLSNLDPEVEQYPNVKLNQPNVHKAFMRRLSVCFEYHPKPGTQPYEWGRDLRELVKLALDVPPRNFYSHVMAKPNFVPSGIVYLKNIPSGIISGQCVLTCPICHPGANVQENEDPVMPVADEDRETSSQSSGDHTSVGPYAWINGPADGAYDFENGQIREFEEEEPDVGEIL